MTISKAISPAPTSPSKPPAHYHQNNVPETQVVTGCDSLCFQSFSPYTLASKGLAQWLVIALHFLNSHPYPSGTQCLCRLSFYLSHLVLSQPTMAPISPFCVPFLNLLTHRDSAQMLSHLLQTPLTTPTPPQVRLWPSLSDLSLGPPVTGAHHYFPCRYKLQGHIPTCIHFLHSSLRLVLKTYLLN